MTVLPRRTKYHAVSRTVIYAQFSYAIEELGVSQQPSLNADNPLGDLLYGANVRQPSEPFSEFVSGSNFDHP